MLKILRKFIKKETKKMRQLEIEKLRKLVKHNFKLNIKHQSLGESKDTNNIEMVALDSGFKPARDRLQTI